MSESAAQFVFMTCRPGAEGALKQEVARAEPTWRLAFSRPGFVTFKLDGQSPPDELRLAERRWTFAHVHGLSLGKLSGTQLADLAAQVWQQEGVVALATKGMRIADIHVWQRDTLSKPDGAPKYDDTADSFATPLAIEIAQALRNAAPASLARLKKSPRNAASRGHRHPSPRGGLVLDVILLEPGQWWIGYHSAVTPVERWPGGHVPAHLPAHAVSRAYAKMEEALAWSGLPIAAGDECVEIGCAPGGASQALLDRGLFVTGIDPADVDPVLLSHPRFRHLKKRGPDVRRSEFLGVRWLAADMNIAPQATLDEVEPIVTHPGVAIRGLVLTLKLSDWDAAAQLAEFAGRVRGWGYRDVRLRQLVSGGQEVCLVALRRKALRRLGRTLSRKRRKGRPTGSQITAPSGEAASAAGPRADHPHSELSGPHF
jgi:23S rRNA (cytidine2498-2'-O)-methyltransferase